MGCGCFLALLAFFFPRVVVVLLWIFSDFFTGVFPSILWPILGFIFLPTTLLWYTAVQHWYGGEWTFIPIAGIVLALIIDVSPAKAKRKKTE
ncbi:MAG: hypothetical protein L0Z48_00245 [candidate division Zixibacteria bacterium]|nr:hypothetical protein [candidate division Zixibacteria bacterium]